MDKTFAVAGISALEGISKVRFAKDLARVKVLEKNGHKDINLIELPKAMNKVEAVEFLMGHSAFKDGASQSVLKEYLSDEKPTKVAKPAKVAKATNSVKTPDEVEAIRAKNLETLKKVHSKVKARAAKESEETEGEVEELEEGLEFEIPALGKRREIEDLDA